MENIIINLFLLIIGFILLIKGADFFVDSASKIATKFRVPKMLIGLTIVAFGTSAPEFAVSIKSLLSQNGDMLLGNVIGSNILNILLILGLSALFGKLTVKINTVRKEIPLLLLITLSFTILITDHIFDFTLTNNLNRQDGFILALIFTIFIYYLINTAKNEHHLKATKLPKNTPSKPLDLTTNKSSIAHHSPFSFILNIFNSNNLFILIILTTISIFSIALGSSFVVDGASTLASGFGISNKIIALTVVALGTSLPELVTSVIATKKGESDIAIGNVVGSNIFNIAIVAGIPVAIFGDIPKASFSYIDLSVMLLSSILLFVFIKNDKKINRLEGILLLAIFVIYYGFTIFFT